MVLTRRFFLIFNSPPGEFTKKLLKNFFFAFFGVGGATLITFGFNVVAVRYLGPIEFGKWNLIGSVAEFFVILPLWGLTAAILRYLGAERENFREIIGTSFSTVLLLTILFFPLYFIFAPFLQDFLKIDALLLKFTILYAFILVFFYLFQSFFQGLEKFKQLSKLLIISAFTFVAIVLLYIFVLNNYSFEALFWSNVWRLILIVFVGLFVFHRFLFRFSRLVFKKLLSFGSYQMLSFLAGFFSLGTIDNIMINYYLGPAAVGLYSAYYSAFSIFIGRILNTFSQVFLPAASTFKDKKILFNQIMIAMKKTWLFILASLFFLIWLLFKFYGSQFIFDWRLAFLMALSVTLYSFLMVLGNIILSSGIKGAKIGPIFAFSAAGLNISLNSFLIPSYQLFGAIIATIITTSIIFLAAVYIIKFKLNKDE